MISVVGVYENGHLRLNHDIASKHPVKVIVTFLEDIQTKSDKVLKLHDFSFAKSKKNLEDFKGSLSGSVVEERRQNL